MQNHYAAQNVNTNPEYVLVAHISFPQSPATQLCQHKSQKKDQKRSFAFTRLTTFGPCV